MRVSNETLQTTATSLGASANLRAVWLGHISSFAIQLVFTGTPEGNFKLQASCDDLPPTGTPTNWTDIADSTITVAAAGNAMWNVENAGYTFVRVVWTRTGSTGSLTVARVMCKGV